ncbi:RNA polymerase sigma factor [Solibacillus sp. FSL K6-1523]|uniref:RNA polymerase sigma factor n=1 Tax=Solibacillus sp. FSL K6-1523 TaxID=2921471 RepID=UPI0030F8D8D2
MTDDLITSLYIEKAVIIKKYLIKNGCSLLDAEDIVQGTFVKAIQYMVDLHEQNLSAWLFKVALHTYYDLCRKSKRYPSYSIEDEEQFFTGIADEVDGEMLFLAKEKGEEITKVLDLLNANQRNLLFLRYEMELSYKEIAELTDMDEKTIKTYLYRARLAFKKKWEETNDEKL